MFDYSPFLCPICGNEMDGLRPIHNPFTNDQMIVIDCEHCETHFEFHDSWDEVLAKLKYAYNEFPTDDVMESAFAGLADALEAQDAELLQEAVDVLTVWEWAKQYGGEVVANEGPVQAIVQIPRTETGIARVKEFATVSAAAEWVRQQEGHV